MTHLYWFRNDLRLEDNPGLAAAASARHLLCVYCLPQPRPWCNTTGMGVHRRRFLHESLISLREALRFRGQELLIIDDDPRRALRLLARRYRVQRISVALAPGVYEAQEVRDVARLSRVPLDVTPPNTLFTRAGIDAIAPKLPRQFTPFRRASEALQVSEVQNAPELPPPPPDLQTVPFTAESAQPHPAFAARGGAEQGMHRLHAWMFREGAVSHYQDTRNALEGLFHYSALSPWLANGCLSARQVAAALADYEDRHGANDSTRHFFSELLWREFFHWRALQDGPRLFRAGGLQDRRPLCCFDPRQHARWCAGDTNYPLVNALMHQLVTTGFMSNRGRQIAASCLVNELGVDWRYGAAFFEKHLLDYDVASNYGNWQYIAGVGNDPRGGRHFNLAKQAELYDPEGEFTARWDGVRAYQPDYAVDAADWPLDPGKRG